jgi:hypothetical protein
MSKLEEEVDKNLSQMNINYEILDNQGKKINRIHNELENIENNNIISQKIIKRLNNLFYRYNPLNFIKPKLNLINPKLNLINPKLKDEKDDIMDKISLMKNIANKMNEKLEEQNELLYDTNVKTDSCIEGIKKNSKLIRELI